MSRTADSANDAIPARKRFAVPVTQGFVTVSASLLALIVLCLAFAPSSLTLGALEGSLPFAAIIAIVGLAQLLVVQQGGFDLSVAGGVSLAVVIATHFPDGDNALLVPAILIALLAALAAGARQRPARRLPQSQRDHRDHRRQRAALRRRVRRLRRNAAHHDAPARFDRRRRDASTFPTRSISRWPRCCWSRSSSRGRWSGGGSKRSAPIRWRRGPSA